ncbi:MAG TPA: ATP-dependent DNA ligase [Steroidobacteraceae bacterium]|nr:ATP-dependent DNA ligase [Steroidobacteraceae bacterium]
MTRLAQIVDTSLKVGATRGRLVKVRELAACLRSFAADEIDIGVHYLSGDTRQGRFGIGYAALRTASGGTAAAQATLTLTDVDRRLGDITEIRGSGSASRRSEALRELFSLATAAEQEFLIRLLIGELRQGALAGVMIDAIVAATEIPAADVRRAAMYAPSLGALTRVALLEGTAGLAQFQLEILHPVTPMLAQTAADTAEALQQLSGEVAFEWKMDGARIQAHKSADTVRIYTRNLNDVTSAVPEIAEVVQSLPAHDIVLDGEAIAFTPSGRPHAFQVTMRRFGRKLDVAKLRTELPMRAFFFDCLRLNGESLADKPARDRFDALAQAVPESLRIPQLITASKEEAQAFYDAAIAAGHEGVMAKSLSSPYEAGNRGASWLKIKRAHTLDLVVLAAEWGHGRRTGKLSNLHLGALDPATGEYVMLGKTFKGLTDAMLEWQTKEFLAREIRRDQWTVYVRPEIVVEIAFSDLQDSPRYPGKFALRLARVKRYRDDKPASEADTMESIRRIYAAQN